MENKQIEISESEKFLIKYKDLLQKVKQRFSVSDSKFLNISRSKASRVLNESQFDILTLIRMASFVGYDVELFFRKRKLY